MNSKKEKHIREIKRGGKTFAIVFSKDIKADGVRFLTPSSYPLQIGLLEHTQGKLVPLHRHPDFRYKVNTTQEVLYVERGSAKIQLTDRAWKSIARFTVTKGDFVLFIDGAHEVNIAPKSRILEIKQGPYPGDKKAKIFKPK